MHSIPPKVPSKTRTTHQTLITPKKKKKIIIILFINTNNSNLPAPHYPPYHHHIFTRSLLTFSPNFNFLNLLNLFSLLTHPHLRITNMTTDYFIYPIYSTSGASSSQPSSPPPSPCLSPPPSVQLSDPPQPPPSPAPSSSPSPLSFPFPFYLEVPLPLQLTEQPHSCNSWCRSNRTWHRPYCSPPQDVPQ